mgnify:CR=1 FL=1
MRGLASQIVFLQSSFGNPPIDKDPGLIVFVY